MAPAVDGFEPIPRVRIIDIATRPGEPLYWRMFSDLHLDEELSDRNYLLNRAKRDKDEFGEVRSLIIGDVSNLVFPIDQRRFTPGVQRKELSQLGAFVKAAVNSNSEFLGRLGYKWDLVGLGNHETSALKHYGGDVADEVARRIGAFRGGYSGAVDYRIHVTKDGTLPDKKTATTLFRVLYHHGAWGGDISKGAGKARAWAEQHDHWHLMLYGHNHKSCVHPEVRVRVRGTGLEEYDAYVIDCGSATRAYAEDARDPGYAEIKGYRREPRKAPLVTYTVRWDGRKRRLLTDYSVTV